VSSRVSPIPTNYSSVTPYLVVSDGAKALEFYKQVFGATVVSRMDGPDGKIGHAEFRIGNSMLMLSDEMPGMGNPSPKTLGGSPVGLHVYVEDVDTVFKRAVGAGAKSTLEPSDQFWGDRYGRITDPFGHNWGIATHIEDVAPEEMKRRVEQEMAKWQKAAAQAT